MTAYTRHWVGRTQQPTLIRLVAWSPDGVRLVGGGEDGSICLWDAKNGTLLQRLPGHHESVMCVAWSPDGSRLASTGGSELLVWEVRSGAGMRALAPHPGGAFAVTWEPSGERLLSGGSDGRLRWWDLHSGACVRVQQSTRRWYRPSR